ncbi:FAD-dependent oxidoreductase [Micromonospora sp. NPDC051925]|uniref:FAD-dependent oxidoreductase n=1 Tax=Micromonospora sp. NPDC051925 TaxID=3364288 RepID=UPI0037C52E5B
MHNSTPGEVVAHFEDGSSAQGAFLIGVDGINSATRTAVFPDAPAPSYTRGIGSGGFARISGVGEPNGELRRHHRRVGPIGRWPLYHLPFLPAWHRGDVCLAGDAAHAISPHMGQGAALALEDAAMLARCLRDTGNVRGAFAAFEQRRRPRVEGLVLQARKTGGQMTPNGPVARALRDLMLPFFLKLSLKNAESVYGYRVDGDHRAPVPAE